MANHSTHAQFEQPNAGMADLASDCDFAFPNANGDWHCGIVWLRMVVLSASSINATGEYFSQRPVGQQFASGMR